MRFSSLRIFWISFISMFAMLSSSFASSAPLMTFQMLNASSIQTDVTSACSMTMDEMSSHAMYMPPSSEKNSHSPCMNDDLAIHSCCTAACVSVFAFLPQSSYSLQAHYQLASIPHESSTLVIQRQQSLYRPPIA
ncbi:putative secreted protein [Vibrio vulnificus]|nr:putative secreted protein [Vibrio vulnificus]